LIFTPCSKRKEINTLGGWLHFLLINIDKSFPHSNNLIYQLIDDIEEGQQFPQTSLYGITGLSTINFFYQMREILEMQA
jgi:hypothetical protein